MNEPLVSVIITSFNRPKLLLRAIDSVNNQTYKNIEILIIDDASTVDIYQFIPNNDKIQVIVNKQNKGGGYSRNRGIENAKGQFINFLDDDDILLPDKIKLQVEKFKTSKIENLGIVTCHANDERSGKSITKYNRIQGNVHRLLLKKFAIHGIETVLYKRECFDEMSGFDTGLPGSQEYDLLIRVSENYSVDFVDKILSKEFRSNDQISLNFPKRKLAAKILLKKITPKLKRQGIIFFLFVYIRYQMITLRYQIGKIFGESIYRKLIR